MQAKFLLLFVIVGLCQAFMIPNDAQNDFYIHRHHKNGTHTHTQINISVNLAKPGWDIMTRNNDESFLDDIKDIILPTTIATCGNGAQQLINVDYKDYTEALKRFTAGCRQRYDYGDYYSIYGSAIVFMCNYSWGRTHCNPNAAHMALAVVHSTCGNTGFGLNSGYLKLGLWAQSYGFDWSRNSICR